MDEKYPVMVSIECCVYNHEPFLRQCLDGFVMQRTNFPFEAIVHDDASTDGSAAIIMEYAEKYPDIIKPIIETENQYSKKDFSLRKIMNAHLRGKYIALCEGDDYWTDPLKLQKQVDYMEKHPECTLCFHNAIVHWANAQQPDKKFASIEDRDYSGIELIQNWYCPTASILYRSSLTAGYTQLRENHPLIEIGDRPLVAHCAKFGKVHALPDIMSVYTKHPEGYTQFNDAIRTFKHARTWEEIGLAFGKSYFIAVKSTFVSFYLSALIRAFRERNFSVFIQSLYRGIIRHPYTGIRSLLMIPYERKRRLSKCKTANC